MAGGETYDGITVPEGDPGALEATAGRLRATAGMLDTVSSALSGLLGGLHWMGPASVSHASLTSTQGGMATTPLKRFREEKTVAAQAGSDGRISISGEGTAKQQQILRRIGENPDLLQTQSLAELRRQFAGIHDFPRDALDKAQRQPDGWYYGTHAELKIAVHEPSTPVGVARPRCGPSCDPALQELVMHTHKDIVVSHPRQTVLHRGADGKVIPEPSPLDFSGINSRWPGLLSGAGGGALGLGAPVLPSP